MEIHKPENVEESWAALCKDRQEKWKAMWQEWKEEGVIPHPLWEQGTPQEPHRAGFIPSLALLPVRKPLPGERKRGTVLLCAGGGFLFQSANEAKPVAAYFHRAGFHTAVLEYSTDPSLPLGGDEGVRRAAREDALRAIRVLRYHSEAWGLDGTKIAIGGFSAGGIVSGLAATGYDGGDPLSPDPIERVSSRPDAVLMLYATLIQTLGGRGSGLGFDWKGENARAALCPERNIRLDSPPFFLFETHGDDPMGILEYGRALAEKAIPFVIHTFPGGPHGGGLFDGGSPDSPAFPHTAKWAELAVDWLEDLGF